jgi:hypothetical protein
MIPSRLWGSSEKGADLGDTGPSGVPARRSLVSLLVEAGVADEADLCALVVQAQQGIRFGELVVGRGLLDEEGMAGLLPASGGCRFWRADRWRSIRPRLASFPPPRRACWAAV